MAMTAANGPHTDLKPGPEGDGLGYTNVVVPLDGTPVAERAVEVAVKSTSREGMVHLVAVIPSSSVGVPDDFPAVVAADDCRSPEYALAGGRFTSDLEHAASYLQAIAERYAATPCGIHWEVRHGSPYNQALQAALDHEADAVVLCQRTASPLKRLVEPDLASFLADRLPLPVVVCLAPKAA